MNNLDFLYQIKGLGVSFRAILSPEIPVKAILSWDFGDDREGAFNVKNPKHEYEEPGFYTVTLNVSTSDGLNLSISHDLMVTDKVKTSLTGSIYELIDHYIPEELAVDMSMEDKRVFINKWQLYTHPLVNHCIPLEEYNNEMYYEGLENQLIMELAVWDYLNSKVYQMLIKAGVYIANITALDNQDGSSETTNSSRGDRIKQITTGPTEVQYYDTLTESASSLYSAFTKALQPGGLIDELRKNLCMLAERLDIFLPFCQQIPVIKAPKVVNRRRKTPLGGPNPTSILNR